MYAGFFLASTVANVDLNINQTTNTYNYALINPFTSTPQVAISKLLTNHSHQCNRRPPEKWPVLSSQRQCSFQSTDIFGEYELHWEQLAIFKDWFYSCKSTRYGFRNLSRRYLKNYSAVTQINSAQRFQTNLVKTINNPVVVTFIAGF